MVRNGLGSAALCIFAEQALLAYAFCKGFVQQAKLKQQPFQLGKGAF